MTRIHGLDLARAVAIIGMMAAHIGPRHFLLEGYPSVLFAVLAGVSMGIISSRAPSLADARVRLLVRAVILVGLGVLLDAVQAGIVVVLIAIGVSYILLLPVLGWRVRWLALLLVGVVVLGPVVGAVEQSVPIYWNSAFFIELIGWPYPITAWLAYILGGLLIHRCALGRPWWMLVGGLAMFTSAQLILTVADVRVGPAGEFTFSGTWAQGMPHSGGFLDVLSSAGLATAVIGACLLACRVAAVVWVTYPLRSVGAMSLSIYLTHVIITTIANGTFVGAAGSETVGTDFGWTMYAPLTDPNPLWPSLFLWQFVGFLVFASLWRWRFRRGPVEWAMRSVVAATTP